MTAGFLAIVLGVTAKALSAGSSHVIALGWIAISLGAATVTLGAAYIGLDALATPPMALTSTAGPSAAAPGVRALADKLRGWAAYLLVPAIAALIASGVFAWLQPGGPAARGAELPGMASVIRWTTLAIAVVLAVALISMLLGLRGSQGTLIGGPWGHSGYWADPRVWDIINQVAARLTDEPPPPGNGAACGIGTSGTRPGTRPGTRSGLRAGPGRAGRTSGTPGRRRRGGRSTGGRRGGDRRRR